MIAKKIYDRTGYTQLPDSSKPEVRLKCSRAPTLYNGDLLPGKHLQTFSFLNCLNYHGISLLELNHH